MRQIVRVGIVLIAVAPVFGLVPGFAATTNEVRCAQLKQAEIGKNANCRLKALSVGTKRQAAPDYAKYDRKLAQKFSRLDQTVCAGNPPSATSVEGFLETITEVVSNAAGITGTSSHGIADSSWKWRISCGSRIVGLPCRIGTGRRIRMSPGGSIGVILPASFRAMELREPIAWNPGPMEKSRASC